VLSALVFWSTAICVAYLLMVFGAYAILVVFAVLETTVRSQQRRAEDFDTLEASRFSSPVSVVVPVHNEENVLSAVLDSLLGLRYPELEIIVVDDGSTDGTLELLRSRLQLVARESYFRRIVETEPIQVLYASEVAPHVRVVVKRNGGKADALNAGLNVARYGYICCVDGDTIYAEDALLKGMRLAMRDPERVVGVTSQIAVASRPESEQADGSDVKLELLDRTILSNFQHIEYLRSFLNNRLAWSRLKVMLCASGAFTIWRRDLLEELGGFSRAFTCEDIEMTFRAHERQLRTGRPYEIISLPEAVATTEAPDRIRSLIAQRARWQRVTLETVWHYRRMILNPRYGVVGLLGLPFYIASEVLAPVFEVLAFVNLAVALWLGLFAWPAYLVFLAIISFANAILSAAAIMLDDATGRSYRLRHVLRLLLLGPLELVAYRPILMWARLRGTWGFLHGHRGWEKFERNVRPAEL
jgi:biofilm PGA synthesis N-glycosyltransferase PgaC